MGSRPSPTRVKAPKKPSIIGIISVVLIVVVLGIGGWALIHRAGRKNSEVQDRTTTIPRGTGEDAMAAGAIAKYLAKVQAQRRAHDAAFQQLRQKNVFSWNIRNRAELDADLQLVHDFLAANTQLTDSMQYGAELVRAELDTAKVPAAARDAALALYAKTQAGSLPLQLRLRQCDQALGERTLDVLELLAWSWGAWRRDETSGRLDFNNLVVQATFKDYAEKTKAAALAQQSAEEALAAWQKDHPQR